MNPVSLWQRFACLFYDSIVLVAIWWGASLPFGMVDLTVPGSAERITYYVYLTTIGVLYFVLCWCRRGATLGMRAWRIHITTRDGNPVRWEAALIRALGGIVSAACFGLGFFWCLFSARRQCWHDAWSATELSRAAAD